MKPSKTRVQVLVSPEIEGRLRSRNCTLTEAAGNAMENYFCILDAGRAEICRTFSAEQFRAIVSVLNGTILDKDCVENMDQEFEDAEEDLFLGENRIALTFMIKDLSLGARFALLDLIEAFWITSGLNVPFDYSMFTPGGIIQPPA